MFDVMVIGGGVIGLSASIAMRLKGYTVAVCDSGPLDASSVPESTRVYAINGASQLLFKQLGVWQSEHTQAPYSAMHIWDNQTGAELDFHARMQAMDALGFIVEETRLKRALLTRAVELGVTLKPNTTIETPEDVLESKLLMIADGALSKTRDFLNVPIKTKPYQHDALVATIEVEKPHGRTAYQVFHPEGPLAFLPLADKNQCSIVWSHPPEEIKRLKALDDTGFNLALEKAFASKLGKTQVLTPRISFPLHMRHVEQYVGRSWMLLGDAAHTIHPLAGLGLNLGLADLSTWMRLLDENKGRGWSSRLLNAYQRERKYEVASVIALMQGIKTLFGSEAGLIQSARGIGMRALNQFGPLKREMMRFASGV